MKWPKAAQALQEPLASCTWNAQWNRLELIQTPSWQTWGKFEHIIPWVRRFQSASTAELRSVDGDLQPTFSGVPSWRIPIKAWPILRSFWRFFSELNSSIPTLVALNSQFLEEKSLFLLATSHHRKHLDFSELPTIHCRETATINLNSSTEGSSWLFPNMATMWRHPS